MHVVVVAAVEPMATQDRIGLEAGLLVGPNGAGVVVEDVEVDPFQAELAEAEVDQAIERIGPQPVALARLVGDDDGD